MERSIPIAEMSFPTRMVVGPGALERLGKEVRALGKSRVLLVADPGVVAVGLAERVESELRAANITYTLFSGISKNPKEKDVLDGVLAYREVQAELIVGLGGGASLDVAKAIGLKATHPLPLVEYDDMKGGSDRIEAYLPPMIAIPTTAGTGSEVGRATVISIGADGRKVVIFSPFMMPKVAICDAELTVSMPAHITAATGMDALTHAIEAYVAKGTHPLADAIALSAIARVGVYLESAVKNGSDIRARHEMMLAASMGAIAFQKGLGACHALAHPLSAVCDLHHGLANSIMLPHVMRYNAERDPGPYAFVAEALGAPAGSSDASTAEAGIDRVEALIAALGLPTRLRDAKVSESAIDKMVPQALEDGCMGGNPHPLDAPAVRRLYREAH